MFTRSCHWFLSSEPDESNSHFPILFL
jgi:hypothetical protein